MRETIDYGIDLGTTNSTIAKVNGIEVEILKNNNGDETTPSAVHIDAKNKLHVGKFAKERLVLDPENSTSEFKQKMGSNEPFTFKRSGRVMTPAELSAEVLKDLKNDVLRLKGEEISSVVITVPAAFNLPENQNTNAAARLSGFTNVQLLLEPVAAAMAYGYQSESDKKFWLVYDFGGGTFDAAVIQLRDGLIQVVNHGGDNYLGGKLIDWEVVNALFLPKLSQSVRLTNFTRSNPLFYGAFAKLKAHAEHAKIRLSREESIEVFEDYLCKDDSGNPVEFQCEITREDFNKVARPFITRSINIARQTVKEKKLGNKDIEKVLLVGGTSLIPLAQEMLLDEKEGLGIPLDSSIYPITVVARGAAIYAGTQRIPQDDSDKQQLRSGEFFLDLEYDPVGNDIEPPVFGRIVNTGTTDFSGYTIEFTTMGWTSGKVLLSKDGAFGTTLWSEKGKKRAFKIDLKDATGTPQKTKPSEISYTYGNTSIGVPLTHSIGVAMADNTTDIFFRKGDTLPVRSMKAHKSVIEIRKGVAEDVLKIPIVEGENINRADRNTIIGYIEIPGNIIGRTIPINSEIEITIEIDQNRLIRTKAFIPILEDEYEDVVNLGKPDVQRKVLEDDFIKEKKRFDDIKKKAEDSPSGQLDEALGQIDQENMMREIEGAMVTVGEDGDSIEKTKDRLLRLKQVLDKAEDIASWPALEKEAQKSLASTREMLDKYGTDEDKKVFFLLEGILQEAIENKEPGIVRSCIDELDQLWLIIVRRLPEYWIAMLDIYKEKKHTMTNESEADALLERGQKAIQANDLEGLKTVITNLRRLLPAKEAEKIGHGGGTMKF